MKKLIFTLMTFAVVLLFIACSNQDEQVIREFNFTYNGKDYHYTPQISGYDNIDIYSGVYNTETRRIYLGLNDVFGGEIYFDIFNCAYLNLSSSLVILSNECKLSSFQNGHDMPIDSSKVFIYQSGSLNLMIADCKTHYLLGNPWYNSCTASGTFELTLANNNNETIKITNGNFKNFESDR